jgi:hypothetical protein
MSGRSISNIYGIQIIEEILLKCGFCYYNGKKDGDLTFDLPCKIDLDFIGGEIKIKSHYEGYDFYRTIPIKYLHQLQNLYHALTGNELNIQL